MRHITLEEIHLGLEVYEQYLLYEAYQQGNRQALTEIRLSFKGVKDLGKKALDKFKSFNKVEKTFVGLLGKLKKETNKEVSDIIKFVRSKSKEYKGKSLKDIQNDIEKLYNEFTGKKVDEALSDKARKIGGFLALALYLATSLVPSAFASADAVAGLDNAPSIETPVDLEGGDDPNTIGFEDAEALVASSTSTDIALDTVKQGTQDQNVDIDISDVGAAISFDTGESDASQADIDKAAQNAFDSLVKSLGGKDLAKAVIDYFGLISNTPGDQDNNPSGADKDGLDSKRLDTAKKIADKVQELLKDKYPDADISIGDGTTNSNSVDGQKEVDRGSKEASSTQVAGVSLDDIETGGEKESSFKIPPAAKTYFKDPKRELKDISRYRAIFSLFLPLIIDNYDESWTKIVTAFKLDDEDFPLTRANMRKKASVLRKKDNKTKDEEIALKIVDWTVESSRFPERLKKQINKLDPKVNMGQRARMASRAPGARGKDMGIPGSGFTQGNTGFQPTDPSGPRANRGQFRGTQVVEQINTLIEARTDFNVLPGFNSSKAKDNLGILVPLYASYWSGEDNQPLSFDIDYVSNTYNRTFKIFTDKYPVISKEKNWDDYQERGKKSTPSGKKTSAEDPPKSAEEPSKPTRARDEKGRFKSTKPVTPTKDDKPTRARDEKGRFRPKGFVVPPEKDKEKSKTKSTDPELPRVDKDPDIERDVLKFREAVMANTTLKNRLKRIDNPVELIQLYTACISFVNDSLHKNTGAITAGLRQALGRVEIPKPVKEATEPKKDTSAALKTLSDYSNLTQLLSRVNSQEELIDLLLNGITPFVNPILHKTNTIKQCLLKAASEFKEDLKPMDKEKKYGNIQRMSTSDIAAITDPNAIDHHLASPYSSIKQRILLMKRRSELVKETKLSKSQIKRRDKLAKDIKKNTIKQYGKEEGEAAAYAIATNQVKEGDCGCGCGDSKINHTINELIGDLVYEELCKRGKAYIAARKRAGEKSSAYLSGRAVKVCKGQIKGAGGKRKKSYKNESLYNQLKLQVLNHLEELFNDPHFAIVAEYENINEIDNMPNLPKRPVPITINGKTYPSMRDGDALTALLKLSPENRKKAIEKAIEDNRKKFKITNPTRSLSGPPNDPKDFEFLDNIDLGSMDESLKNWFGKEDWVRIDTQGNIAGKCGTMPKGKATQRCLPRAKANSLTKAQRRATARKKVRGSKKGKQFVRNTKKAKVSFKKK